jgi:hypothetical protein
LAYPGPIDTDVADRLDFEKASASDVAAALVEALKKRMEDVSGKRTPRAWNIVWLPHRT